MNTTPRSDDYAVIVNADRSILLMNGSLPHVPHDPPHFWQTCEPVNRAIQRSFGLTVSTVRCLKVGFSDGREPSVYLMEYQGGDLPPDSQWVDASNLPMLSGAVSTTDLQAWLTTYTANHRLRKAWYSPGFFQQVALSLPDRLSGKSILRVEHIRSWERSWVARIVTDAGDFYYKAIPPMFACEADLSGWLTAYYPANFLRVLDVRSGQDFIMDAYQGKSLMESPELTVWMQALSQYARLQADWVGKVDELRALGVPQRDLGWIEAHTDALLADETALKSGTMPLKDDEIKRLRELTPRLHAACEVLGAFNIPLSLEHGDLWSGQIIARDDGGFYFTDWSDCAITHPFFSLPFFLAEVHNELPPEPAPRPLLTDTYLEAWTRFESPVRLSEMLPHLQLLSPLYSALRYYRDVLPQMEMRWEMENMLAYNLRLLLRDA